MDSTVKNYLLELLERQEDQIRDQLEDELFEDELEVISNCFDFLNNKVVEEDD